MKFKDDSQKRQFLADVGRLDLQNSYLEKSQLCELASERRAIARRISKSEVDRSLEYSKNYAGELSKILGWKKFAGILRAFLGRYPVDKPELLKAVSSLRTHIYIELDYYRPMSAEIEFLAFFDYMIPRLFDLEKRIFESNNFKLDDLDDDLKEILTIVTTIT